MVSKLILGLQISIKTLSLCYIAGIFSFARRHLYKYLTYNHKNCKFKVSIFIFTLFLTGQLWVNNVQIVGWTQMTNGVILALDNYLYTEHVKDDMEPRTEEDDKEEFNQIDDSPVTEKETKSTRLFSIITTPR